MAIASALCQEHVSDDNVGTEPSSDGGYRVNRISVTTMFVQDLCLGQESQQHVNDDNVSAGPLSGQQSQQHVNDDNVGG